MKTKDNPLDYIGKTFYKYTVISYVGRRYNVCDKWKSQFNHIFLCQCTCGTIKNVSLNNLKSKRMKGCKNCAVSIRSKNNITKHPTFHYWNDIIRRCYSEKHGSYKCYSALGIKVCARWLNFNNFIQDFPHLIGKYIVRIDKTKDFSPENCRLSDKPDKFTRYYNTLLTSAKLAKLTGYTRERVSQMTGGLDPQKDSLVPYIKDIIHLNKSIRFIYTPEAINFLIERRSKWLNNVERSTSEFELTKINVPL